jgi:hypothetical protein
MTEARTCEWEDDEWVDYDALCAIAGWHPDLRRLKELRRAGLVRPTRQVYPPGLRGSVTLYARADGDQLRRIKELSSGDRRHDEMLLALWWERRWVDREKLRGALTALLDDAGLREVRRLTEEYPDVYERADVVLAAVKRRARRNPILRQFRSQLFRRRLIDLDTVMYALALLMFGEEPAWRSYGDPIGVPSEAHPNDLVRSATGYARTNSDRYQITGRPLGPLLPPTNQMMEKFQPLVEAGVLPLTNLPEVLAAATDEELDLGRDDVRFLVEPFMQFSRVAQAVFGRGALGLGIPARIEPSPANRAFLTVMVVGLRRAWTAEQLGNRNRLVKAFAEAAPTLRQLEKKETDIDPTR